jgi:hypothetical protein
MTTEPKIHPAPTPPAPTIRTWTQADQTLTDQRIAASLQRAAARVAAIEAAERSNSAP